MANKCIIGVDAGGTFTDFVAVDDTGLRSCKVLSTPDNPALAILEGLRLLGVEDGNCQVVHGTTVGTNAVLEGKGARVAFITNKGFADLLTIGRQQREQLFALQQPQPPQPVPDELCLEVDARVAADGTVLRQLTNEDVDRVVRQAKELGAEAVAVTLLFSFLYPEMEEQLESGFGADWFVSRSSAVLPVIREYERGIATWLNSYIGPLLSEYLAQLQSRLPNASISVMQSVGTTIEAEAGGLAAAQFLGSQLDCPKILSFDMGGTSTDVALLDGGIELASNGRIGGYPVAVPMVDMHTIGAGGGSIARVDEAGLLLVGPESAGADPGPACYNNGGKAVTVTDAHVVLGRIPKDTLLGGRMPLNESAARTGLEQLGKTMGCDALEAARGVIRVANEHMARALRVISVERGHDPEEYALFSFGGAGGLHVCELADMLEIRKALVPASSGVLSALGLLVSPPGRVLTQPVLQLLQDADDAAVNGLFEQLAANAGRSLAAEGVASGSIGYRRQAELRYLGQEHALTLDYSPHEDLNNKFQQAHEHRYGHRLEQPVELVNLRLLARGIPALRDIQSSPSSEPQAAQQLLMPELGREVAFLRLATLPLDQDITGPAIIADDFATSWVAQNWVARKDRNGHLHIRKA
jgi:N-methylhydantoinase A